MATKPDNDADRNDDRPWFDNEVKEVEPTETDIRWSDKDDGGKDSGGEDGHLAHVSDERVDVSYQRPEQQRDDEREVSEYRPRDGDQQFERQPPGYEPPEASEPPPEYDEDIHLDEDNVEHVPHYDDEVNTGDGNTDDGNTDDADTDIGDGDGPVDDSSDDSSDDSQDGDTRDDDTQDDSANNDSANSDSANSDAGSTASFGSGAESGDSGGFGDGADTNSAAATATFDAGPEFDEVEIEDMKFPDPEPTEEPPILDEKSDFEPTSEETSDIDTFDDIDDVELVD